MFNPIRLVMVENICHMCDIEQKVSETWVNYNLGWFCCDQQKCKDKLYKVEKEYFKQIKCINFNKFQELFPEIDLIQNYRVERSNKLLEDDWNISNSEFSKIIQFAINNKITDKYNESVDIIIWVTKEVTEKGNFKKAQKLKDFIINNSGDIKISYEEFTNRILKYLEL